jgi:hypothetical protein
MGGNPNKANSAQLKLELGLGLAIFQERKESLLFWIYRENRLDFSK